MKNKIKTFPLWIYERQIWIRQNQPKNELFELDFMILES